MEIHEVFGMIPNEDVQQLAADLSPQERAVVAARITLAETEPVTHQQLADLFGIHATTITRAARVVKQGVPDLLAGMLAGSISLGAAYQLAQLPADEQQAAIRGGHIATAAEQIRRRNWQSHRSRIALLTGEQKARQRREQIRDLAASGHDSAQIAAAVGIAQASCRNILRQEGIDCPGDRAHGRARKHDPARILQQIVMDAENLLIGDDLIDYTQLRISPARLAEWIAALDAARDALGSFIRKLRKEKVRNDHEAA